MRSRGRILTAWAACGAAALQGTVAIAAAPIPAARPMYFEHVTVRDGLSFSVANGILQDSQGYLWFATEAGLNRYDGNTIRQFRRERGNEHGLASDYFWSIAEDAHGDLWLATDAGLNRYDGNTIRQFRRERGNEHGLASDYFWSIAEDAHGDLWLATDGGGVVRWERRTEQFQQFRHDPAVPQSLASDGVRALLIDAQGQIWAGTKDQGLDVLDPNTGHARHYRHQGTDAHSLPSDAIGALYADHEGRIWVGSDGGLSRFDAASNGFINYGEGLSAAHIGDLRVRAIREDHTGALWVGTVSGGLARIEPAVNRTTIFRHDPMKAHSLSHDHVWAVIEDDAQRLWVATADGLNLFDRNSESFVRYGHDQDNPQSLRDSNVASLYQDRGGVL